MSEDFRCWYPVQIRFRDLDPLAHVNNTVYFTYFEEARIYYFNQLNSWLEQWPSGEEQQEAESIVSHPPHNPRIQTRPNGPHYGVLVKEVTCTYMLRPWCGAITSLEGLIPFRRHYALLLNRGRVEPGLHPAERAGLSNSLFAERGKPCSAKRLLEGGLGLFTG